MPTIYVMPGASHTIKTTPDPGYISDHMLWADGFGNEKDVIIETDPDGCGFGIFTASHESILDLTASVAPSQVTMNVASGSGHIDEVKIDSNPSGAPPQNASVLPGSTHTIVWTFGNPYRIIHLYWNDGTQSAQLFGTDILNQATFVYDPDYDLWTGTVQVTVASTDIIASPTLRIVEHNADERIITVRCVDNHGTYDSDDPGGFFQGDTVKFTFTPNAGYQFDHAEVNSVVVPTQISNTGVGTLEYTVGSTNATIDAYFVATQDASFYKDGQGCSITLSPAQPKIGLICNVVAAPVSNTQKCATLTHNNADILQQVTDDGIGFGSFIPGTGSNDIRATVMNKPAEQNITFTYSSGNPPLKVTIDGVSYNSSTTYIPGSHHICEVFVSYKEYIEVQNNSQVVPTQEDMIDRSDPNYPFCRVYQFQVDAGQSYDVYIDGRYEWLREADVIIEADEMAVQDIVGNGEIYINRTPTPGDPDMILDSDGRNLVLATVGDGWPNMLCEGDIIHIFLWLNWVDDGFWCPTDINWFDGEEYGESVLKYIYIEPKIIASIDLQIDTQGDHGQHYIDRDVLILRKPNVEPYKMVDYNDIGKIKMDHIADTVVEPLYLDE